MTTTRDAIIEASDRFVRQRGFNGFSFYDIAAEIGIKTASIHYHFPSKSDLVVATIRAQAETLDLLKKKVSNKSPFQQLDAFFSIYDKTRAEDMVCIVGSIATDLKTVGAAVRVELTKLAAEILAWVTEILRQGKAKKVFHFSVPERTKALMIITNMLGIVQVMRLTGKKDFEAVKQSIIKELTT